MAKLKIDHFDVKILEIVQENSEAQLSEISEKVGLSSTPCWRRIQRLRETGVIAKQVMLLDPRKVNVGMTAFVSIRTSDHSQEWFERFQATVQLIPEVVEFYRMSGDVDYLLRVVVPNIAAFDGVYKRLIAKTSLHGVSSSFAMEEIKFTTSLPLGYVE